MSRKRCRRKVWPLVDPVRHAIEGARITSESELDKLRLRELAAIDAFARGRAQEIDWYDIDALARMTLTMAERGVGRPEAMPALDIARQHLAADMRRFRETGRMGTTGPGLVAYRDLFVVHDAQRQAVARSEYEAAIQQAVRKASGGAHA